VSAGSAADAGREGSKTEKQVSKLIKKMKTEEKAL
jgi:hypothetical protein